MVNDWLYDKNENCMIGAMFPDLRKAFGLVDHEILQKRLTAYHFD